MDKAEKLRTAVLDVEHIQSLIDSLESAKQAGFGSTSSPTEFLFETAIDICLLLGKALKEGPERPGREINQIPSEPDIYDELHNQPIVFIGPKRTRSYMADEEAAQFINNELASFFVEMKNRVPFKQVYSRLFRKSYSKFQAHASLGETAKNLSERVLDVLPIPEPAKEVGKAIGELASQLVKTRREAKMAQNIISKRAFRERQERRRKQNK